MRLGKVKLVVTTRHWPGVHSLTTPTANGKIVFIFYPAYLEKTIYSSRVKLASVHGVLLIKYKEVAEFSRL